MSSLFYHLWCRGGGIKHREVLVPNLHYPNPDRRSCSLRHLGRDGYDNAELEGAIPNLPVFLMIDFLTKLL